jgi:hypothetical protein
MWIWMRTQMQRTSAHMRTMMACLRWMHNGLRGQAAWPKCTGCTSKEEMTGRLMVPWEKTRPSVNLEELDYGP